MDDTIADEGWQDWVSWDLEFDGEIPQEPLNSFPSTITLPNQSFESEASEQPDQLSAQFSATNEFLNFDSFHSAPQSFPEDHFSMASNRHTSSLLDPIITSPLESPAGSYFHLHGASFNGPTHSTAHTQDSPVLDTRFDRIPGRIEPIDRMTTMNTLLNPYVANSAHSFSNLDLRATLLILQADEQVRPAIVEPIAEDAELSAGVSPPSISDMLPQAPDIQSQSVGPRSQAVTIPRSSRAVVRYSNHLHPSHMLRRASPRPPSRRQSQSSARSKNMRNDDRESGHKLNIHSPSPDSLGWISYSADSRQKMVLVSTEGIVARVSKGRKKALTTDQRTQTAFMRIIGACTNCQRRKGKCDPGTPCKNCLVHFKADLIHQPCRGRRLSELSASFLSGHPGWHPTARSIESIFPPNNSNILIDQTVDVPVNFGFGRPLTVTVHPLLFQGRHEAHDHIIYPWPPGPESYTTHTNAVFPAVLTNQSKYGLSELLNQHLSYLVKEKFNDFPHFSSPLQILYEVYTFFRNLPDMSHHACLLHQALKLLVLVHIGGDVVLPKRSQNAKLDLFISKIMEIPDDITPTPCLIRAQFGSVEPGLAQHLSIFVLDGLEHLLLNRAPSDWPITLAVLLTVLMTLESVYYHAAKLPFHHDLDPQDPQRSSRNPDIHEDENVQTLFKFYKACFHGCHARLRPDWAGEVALQRSASVRLSPGDAFIEGVRAAMKRAYVAGYLPAKTDQEHSNDIGRFFDTLVVRLLVHGC